MCRKLILLISFVLVLNLALTCKTNAELVGWWKLDDGSGTTAQDSTGNGNNGTLNGGAVWQAGKFGGGVYLDGTDDYIEVPDLISQEGSVCFWFKPDWDGSDPQDYRLFDASEGAIYFFISKGANHADINPEDFGFYLEDGTDADYQGIEINPAGVIIADTWFHVLVTWQFGGGPAILYIDGQEVARADTLGPLPALYANPRFGLQTVDYIPSANGAMGVMDDIRFYDHVLSEFEILSAMTGEIWPYAWSPEPADGAILRDTWVNLSWKPGGRAVSHDVYLGENFDEVDTGTGDTFGGNQLSTSYIIGFPGFPYSEGLVPGTTYYWRIDEVNEADPKSPWKGDIWSLMIAPRTAYNPNPADGAELVDPDVQLNWNPGFGAVLHYVYFGESFEEVNNAAGGIPQGTTTYKPDPLKLAKTYYWRIDEFDAMATSKGEVWSFTTEGAVGSPNPSNGAVDVKQTQTLSWVPGVYAASHQVYFGADEEAVRNANTGSPEYKGTRALGVEGYDPGKLQWDTNYYWRIDEVNNVNSDSPWKGPVWSFTTANFLIVDDFEDYNDYEPDRIFDVWIDGWGIPANGATVGYPEPDFTAGEHFVETTIVQSGSQSMPYFYDNNLMYSEATMTLIYPKDWTEKGVSTLTIWFRGDPANVAERMYVALNGSAVVYNDDPGAAQIAKWTEWNIDLQKFADQGVNLASVNTISIGFGDKNSIQAGGAGTMFFDDIRLYPPPPEPEQEP